MAKQTRMDPYVAALLAELEQRGATVTRGPRSTKAQLDAAERQLGFPLPPEYREHLLAVGGLTIERGRTWRFYGLADALTRTREYAAYFAEAVAPDSDDAYVPRRFIVLHDEGDHANAAAGTVHDADLDAMLATDGARGVDRSEALQIGYGALLCDALEEIRDRIAEAAVTRDDAPADLPELAAAVEQLYAVFATYPRKQLRRRCAHDPRCKACEAIEGALNDTPLGVLTTEKLAHYAYFYPPNDAEEPGAAERSADYIAPLLATWTANLDDDAAALHAAVVVAGRELDQPADYWGWQEPAFARLNTWIRSPALREAFAARARVRGANVAFAEALETLS